MDELRNVLVQADRAASSVRLPDDQLEHLIRLRARRERNQRLATRLLAMVITVGVIALALLTRGEGGDRPLDHTPVPTPRFRGEIAYWSRAQGTRSIAYLMHPDGGVVALSRPGGFAGPVGWSADGSKLLIRTEGGLRVVRYDGATQAVPLADSTHWDLPRWSPDGTRLAFLEGGGLFVADSDGSNKQQIADNVDDFTGFTDLSWSPDGSKVAYVGDHLSGIWLANADASGTVRILGPGHGYDTPEWSPDGDKIAFGLGESPTGCCAQTILVMNADGSGVSRLRGGLDPVWSPDGSKIAFWEGPIGGYVDPTSPGTHGVFVMNADGSEAQLVSAAACRCGLSWSPDGSSLAFAESNPGTDTVSSIVVVRLDDLTTLYRTPLPDRSAMTRGPFLTVRWDAGAA